jgi:hypothetical protein
MVEDLIYYKWVLGLGKIFLSSEHRQSYTIYAGVQSNLIGLGLCDICIRD